MYYVYILFSFKDRELYTGSTSDLKRRIKEHFNGNSTATSYRLPLKLIYYEAYLLKQDALAREKYLKTSMGMRVIKKTIGKLFKNWIKNHLLQLRNHSSTKAKNLLLETD